MRLKYLSIVLVVWMSACGNPSSSSGTSLTPADVEAEDVSFTFRRKFASGTYVFHSQAELDSAWDAAPFESFPGVILTEPDRPTYDFSEKMVVGFSRDVGPMCLYPTIVRVERTGPDTVVHYLAPTKTSTGCLYVKGPLVAFAVVPRAEGDVGFVQDPNE